MKSLKKYLNSVSQFADAILNIIGCLCQNLIIFSKIFSLSQHALNTDKNTRIKRNTHTAFSLVEMLMALLVASLLMAALAPVMTKKYNDPEIKVMSEASNYEKSSVFSVITDSSEQQEFNIPSDASKITLTMMGGGGSGGNALYGNKTFTASGNFTIPKDVKKIRVFMIGGGGGGASGGFGTGLQYGNVPAIGSTSSTITTAGNYTFADLDTPTSHIAPSALPHYCQKFGTTKKWVVASNTATAVNPGARIAKIDKQATVRLFKTTMCGAGGGGGQWSAGGGSGGYITNVALNSAVAASNISIKIGSGGKNGNNGATGGSGGGTGGAEGGGKASWMNGSNGNGGSGNTNGGGGGGGTAIIQLPGGTVIAEIGGGGGGGGHCWAGQVELRPTCWASAGGGGGGKGSGGGGGAASVYTDEVVWCNAFNGHAGNSNGTGGELSREPGNTSYYGYAGGNGYGGGGGGGAGALCDNPYRNGLTGCNTMDNGTAPSGSGGGGGGWKHQDYPAPVYAWGGGGGGGKGGAGGKPFAPSTGTLGAGGQVSTIFGSNNCNGGTADTDISGKPGAARIWYSVDAVANGLQCEYYQPSNGGGGGGAGQVWMGEIEVSPLSTISINIGQGGGIQSLGAENGNDGTATSITVNGSVYSVSGGKGGKFENDGTYIANSGGLGGGLNKNNLGTKAVYKDWLKINEDNSILGGKNGGQGYLKTDSMDGAGGIGGAALTINGNYLPGGNGGESGGTGINAPSISYGAGGGGGAGNINGSFGVGGKGANGYVYIEWGGTNGGGGTNGEIIQKVLTNFDGNDRKMIVNIGKGGDSSINDGKGGDTTVSVKSGGRNVTVVARGGIGGDIGHSDIGIHGGETEFPTNYDKLYKEFIQENMNIIMGQKGSNDYGGMGGYINCLYKVKDSEGNIQCAQIMKANDGMDASAGPVRPGCGGTSMTAPLYDSICIPFSTSANPNGGNGMFGGGGGGGAVLNNIGGKGGKGGDGFVILEYKSVQ